MRVVRLKSENVMRLVAVDITPEGHLITIGGKNGAGKTSVLNSIAMALGGAALVPDEPIRTGEASAKIEVDLGDYKVTRSFARLKLDDGTWGPTESKLQVTNTHGAPFPSPQALLNKLLGKLTFDPLAFAMADPKPQYDMLRTLVNLDVSSIEQTRQNAYAQRSVLNKSHDIKSSQMMKLVTHKDVPAEEIPLTEINAELAAADAKRDAMTQTETEYFEAMRARDARHGDLRIVNSDIERLEKELAVQRAAQTKMAEDLVAAEHALKAADDRRILAASEVPDMAALRQKLTHVQTVNAKIRDNLKYAEAAAEVDRIGQEAKAQDQIVKDCEEQKRAMLDAVKFPVDGLGLSETGVTFKGIPFKQAATSEQIRVSVAIGLAMNPTLKVLLIRNGNALDDDSLLAVAEQANTADAQVWMEYVTKDAADVSVLIEDGRASSGTAVPQSPVAAVASQNEIDLPFQLG